MKDYIFGACVFSRSMEAHESYLIVMPTILFHIIS
jgi:hypothetical protein